MIYTKKDLKSFGNYLLSLERRKIVVDKLTAEYMAENHKGMKFDDLNSIEKLILCSVIYHPLESTEFNTSTDEDITTWLKNN